jgi:hypothetical protein
MDGSPTTPSAQLLEANRQLYELRSQARAQRLVTGLPVEQDCPAEADPPWDIAAPEKLTVAELIATLPDHLGWGSEALTRALRQGRGRQQVGQPVVSGSANETAAAAGDDAGWHGKFAVNGRMGQAADSNGVPSSSASAETDSMPSPNTQPADNVKLYPDIGLAMLRQEQTAAGRLWLLLRALDEEGRGWLRVANIRPLLTKKTSTTYLCTWRQLRNLLHEGEGLYWTRDEECIWLRSAAKVAFGLGVVWLSGRPVALPLEALLNGIGRFRAELYAAFHSGRVKTTPDGEPQAAPIARETLTNLSGVGETTQRRYEQQLEREETAVHIQPNFAIGHKVSQQELEEKSWQQGNALFTLEDFRGQQGPKGRQYVAWQLPNSYTGSHQHRPKGRQRRINRQLRDLVMKGMPGNEGEAVGARQPDPARDKLYYPTGKLAAKAFNRRKVDQCYWRQVPANAGMTRNGRYAIWQHLEQNQREGAANHA